MVLKYGMSPKVGLLEQSEKSIEQLSPETRELVEQEVQSLLTESYERAKQLLAEHKNDLETLANALLKYETLTREEIHQVLQGQSLSRNMN